MFVPAKTLLLIAFLILPLSPPAGVDRAAGAPDAVSRMTIGSSIIRRPLSPFIFSVYPAGGNGELGASGRADPDVVLRAIDDLRDDRDFAVHLFTAWSWHDDAALDAEIDRYAGAGLRITLSVKYSPPAGRHGDVEGFVAFARSIVARHGANPSLYRVVIGNEGNVTWGNPDASDGPFPGVDDAITRGVIAARQELDSIGSLAQVGVNYAVTGGAADAAYLQGLVKRGGEAFQSAVEFLGLNVYPGLWPVGSGDPYADMAAYLREARAALTASGFSRVVSIDVLENGYPTLDEQDQATRLEAMTRAVLDNRSSAGVSGYSWFGLLDADTSSDSPFAHYGLLRSDMSRKAAFDSYRSLIAGAAD
jgi:hypothetical protein